MKDPALFRFATLTCALVPVRQEAGAASGAVQYLRRVIPVPW